MGKKTLGMAMKIALTEEVFHYEGFDNMLLLPVQMLLQGLISPQNANTIHTYLVGVEFCDTHPEAYYAHITKLITRDEAFCKRYGEGVKPEELWQVLDMDANPWNMHPHSVSTLFHRIPYFALKDDYVYIVDRAKIAVHKINLDVFKEEYMNSLEKEYYEDVSGDSEFSDISDFGTIKSYKEELEWLYNEIENEPAEELRYEYWWNYVVRKLYCVENKTQKKLRLKRALSVAYDTVFYGPWECTPPEMTVEAISAKIKEILEHVPENENLRRFIKVLEYAGIHEDEHNLCDRMWGLMRECAEKESAEKESVGAGIFTEEYVNELIQRG